MKTGAGCKQSVWQVTPTAQFHCTAPASHQSHNVGEFWLGCWYLVVSRAGSGWEAGGGAATPVSLSSFCNIVVHVHSLSSTNYFVMCKYVFYRLALLCTKSLYCALYRLQYSTIMLLPCWLPPDCRPHQLCPALRASRQTYIRGEKISKESYQ